MKISTPVAVEAPVVDTRGCAVGAWGMDPWDNDTAADWFGDLWSGTPVVDRVISTLEGDDSEALVGPSGFAAILRRRRQPADPS